MCILCCDIWQYSYVLLMVLTCSSFGLVLFNTTVRYRHDFDPNPTPAFSKCCCYYYNDLWQGRFQYWASHVVGLAIFVSTQSFWCSFDLWHLWYSSTHGSMLALVTHQKCLHWLLTRASSSSFFEHNAGPCLIPIHIRELVATSTWMGMGIFSTCQSLSYHCPHPRNDCATIINQSYQLSGLHKKQAFMYYKYKQLCQDVNSIALICTSSTLFAISWYCRP